MIALQADAAAAALAKAPERAAAPIAAIRRSAAEALAEMRRVVGMLRVAEEEDLRPQPGLVDVPALVEQSRAAGAHVDLTLRPPSRPTHASVELAAYRLVQEALTNARRHAPGAPVDVRVVGDDAEVVVEVVNRRDGAHPHPPAGVLRLRARRHARAGPPARRPPGRRADGRRRLRADRPPPARAAEDAVTSVVVVDDQQLVRDGLRLILELSGVEVLGEAADGREGVRLVLEHRPDVVLMDLRMPDMDGIEATRRIVAAGSPTRVLVLTTFEGEELTYRALQAGASGYLLKDAGGDRLVAAVQAAATGEMPLAPEVVGPAGRLLRAATTRGDPAERQARPPERPGTGRARAHGRRPVQSRDRRRAVHLARHGEEPRPAHPGQARPAGPRPGDRPRPRVRAGRRAPAPPLGPDPASGSAHEPAPGRRPLRPPVEEGGEEQLDGGPAAARPPAPAARRPDRPRRPRSAAVRAVRGVGRLRARAARSSASSASWTPGTCGSRSSPRPPTTRSGTTSSGASGRCCPAGAAWPCSTAPGTAGCSSSGSRASPPRRPGSGRTRRSSTSRPRSPPRA